jgi:hypothetical protein|tara:strand:- start:178 stop:579 length:402 start_codon:yes stop_codon:yes gene_type:complete
MTYVENMDKIANFITEKSRDMGRSDTQKGFCEQCGSKLGIDCGDAEPDYSEQFCSVGCWENSFKEIFGEQIKDNQLIGLIADRMKTGHKKYKNTLPVDDGRDWLEEALQELLDGCVYLANMLILIKRKRDKNL